MYKLNYLVFSPKKIEEKCNRNLILLLYQSLYNVCFIPRSQLFVLYYNLYIVFFSKSMTILLFQWLMCFIIYALGHTKLISCSTDFFTEKKEIGASERKTEMIFFLKILYIIFLSERARIVFFLSILVVSASEGKNEANDLTTISTFFATKKIR